MEAVNGVSDGDKGAPPPPSPLTGCYLLIVVGEPHCNEHKDIILQRVAKGERPLFSQDLAGFTLQDLDQADFIVAMTRSIETLRFALLSYLFIYSATTFTTTIKNVGRTTVYY